MSAPCKSKNETSGWTPIPDPADRFSSGIPDFDRLIGGGFPRGGMALFNVDPSVGPEDRELLLTPTLLNFLTQSNGIVAVLPSRESPHSFRLDLTRWVSRRLFDTRVRVVSYVGEDSEAPYVVDLHSTGPKGSPAAEKRKLLLHMERMVQAERAVRGARARMFLEMMAFEIMDMEVGSEKAARMFFHGIKRTREHREPLPGHPSAGPRLRRRDPRHGRSRVRAPPGRHRRFRTGDPAGVPEPSRDPRFSGRLAPRFLHPSTLTPGGVRDPALGLRGVRFSTTTRQTGVRGRPDRRVFARDSMEYADRRPHSR